MHYVYDACIREKLHVIMKSQILILIYFEKAKEISTWD